jgi:hypothetical protein
MKYIGFIKRFDPERPGSKDLADMFIEQKIDEGLRASIIDYLSSGNFLFGWMSFLREEDGTPIGNNDFYTDGCYVWPLYYIYYLNKYTSLEIDERFIDHVQKNNFIIPQLSKDELTNLENEYFNFLR